MNDTVFVIFEINDGSRTVEGVYDDEAYATECANNFSTLDNRVRVVYGYKIRHRPDSLISLTSNGRHEVTGRGTVFTFNSYGEDPSQLLEKIILIDGRKYLVRGVEKFAIGDGTRYNLPFGLLVRKIED